MNNELTSLTELELTESELLSINGGGLFSTAGEYVGKALAYACYGLRSISTADQVRWYNHRND